MKLGEVKTPKIEETQQVGKRQRSASSLQVNISLDKQKPTRTRFTSAHGNQVLNIPPQVAKKKKNFLHFFYAHKIFTFFLIILVAFGSFYLVKLNELKKTGLQIGVFDPVKTVISAVSAPQDKAIDKLQQTDDRTNFVVVGVDARTYNESLLTDSIIVLSYDHKTNKIAQISFPRDLEARYQINGRDYHTKINSAFPLTYSSTKSFDKAFENLGSAITNISGLKVHYGIMINFRGFKEIIDTLGGITVDVERSFTDYTFPNDNDTGVITVSFKAGVQTMNGTRALQYSRSRHSMDNGEGSDFMRARRQQKVMNAVKEKFIESDLINKADSINQIISTLGNNIKFYQIGGNEINIAVQSRDLLKSVSNYSMVIDPNFGSYTNHLLIGGDKGGSLGYAVTPNNAKDFSKVKDLITFYLENSFLLEENAKIRLVWTNNKRNNDYLSAKKVFWDNGLPFEFVDGLVRVAEQTVSPTPTNTDKSSKGTLYTLNSGKDKTIEFYTNLFSKDGINFEIKDGIELPKELERFRTATDILLVID